MTNPRYYFLPLQAKCLQECSFCEAIGCCHETDRSTGEIEKILRRAKSAFYTGVIFPCNAIHSQYLDFILQSCQEKSLLPILQVNLNILKSSESQKIDTLIKRGWGIQALWNQDVSEHKDLLLQWKNKAIFFTSTHVFEKQVSIRHIKSWPQALTKDLFFYFSYSIKSRLVFRTIEKIKKLNPQMKVRTLPGLDIWDPQISGALTLEPELEPNFKQKREGGFDISVIIPTYNNKSYILNVLDHLADQDLDYRQFEIILVDDGSDDGTQTEFKIWLEQNPNMNIQYFYFPRAQKRQMGDGQFRAGIARNLGVKKSSGGILCFLDSDILVSPYFLSDLLIKHRHWDVIQCRRWDLKRDVSGRHTRYEQISELDLITEKADMYWENFNKISNWMSQILFWKYTCTYGLSMSREAFSKAGWLRKTFVYYGFEDTDLGYRLSKLGYRFLLNTMDVYHLYHQNERSEFKNDIQLRKKLLMKTAKVFYINCLDAEVYSHFKHLLVSEPFWIRDLKRWSYALVSQLRINRVLNQAKVLAVLRKVAMQIYTFSYPIRKIYYFTEYQWDKRIKGFGR